MSTLSIEKPQNLESAAPKKGSAKSNCANAAQGYVRCGHRQKTAAVCCHRSPSEPPPRRCHRRLKNPELERVTKQERMLTLLSRPEGASIEEMMQATDWQQHSVRGFLAGTVKKKLGFSLTSSKPDDGVRRYRIETRRGR